MSVFYSTVPQSLSSAPIAYATTSLNSSTAVESTNLCPGKRARELEQGGTERHYAGITHANGIAAENTSIAADEREFKRLRRAFERDSL
ncbi:5895_t:CDS:1, partial [Paraglomus occultum]